MKRDMHQRKSDTLGAIIKAVLQRVVIGELDSSIMSQCLDKIGSDPKFYYYWVAEESTDVPVEEICVAWEGSQTDNSTADPTESKE